jgi:hypothetical protein
VKLDSVKYCNDYFRGSPKLGEQSFIMILGIWIRSTHVDFRTKEFITN